MANQVYETTHEGLLGVMSPKAATHVLKKALGSQGFSAKSITGSEMQVVLMGPVYQELTSIMPKEGVERTLKQIIKILKKQAKDARSVSEETPENSIAAILPATPEISETLQDMKASQDTEEPSNDPLPVIGANVLLFDEEASADSATAQNRPEDIDFEETGFASTEPSPENASSSTVEALLTQAIASVPQPAPLHARVYTQAELGNFLMRFAQVENIKIVALVQSNGVIQHSRGSGFDLAAISRIGSMGLKLLSRGRHIHSFYLSHQKGQLFLFPLADHTLIVVGNNEVNVGEVFTTLSTLEEHL